MGEIIDLTTRNRQEDSPEEQEDDILDIVIQQLKEEGVTDVFIVGETDDGRQVVASTIAEVDKCNTMLDRAKYTLLLR